MSILQSTPMKAPGTAEHAENVDYEKYDLDGSDSFITKVVEHGGITHNPLRDIDRSQLIRSVNSYVDKHGLSEDRDFFIRGAILAQTGETDHLPPDELNAIERETTHKWDQPKTLYYLCIMCAICAVSITLFQTRRNNKKLTDF